MISSAIMRAAGTGDAGLEWAPVAISGHCGLPHSQRPPPPPAGRGAGEAMPARSRHCSRAIRSRPAPPSARPSRPLLRSRRSAKVGRLIGLAAGKDGAHLAGISVSASCRQRSGHPWKGPRISSHRGHNRTRSMHWRPSRPVAPRSAVTGAARRRMKTPPLLPPWQRRRVETTVDIPAAGCAVCRSARACSVRTRSHASSAPSTPGCADSSWSFGPTPSQQARQWSLLPEA